MAIKHPAMVWEDQKIEQAGIAEGNGMLEIGAECQGILNVLPECLHRVRATAILADERQDGARRGFR